MHEFELQTEQKEEFSWKWCRRYAIRKLYRISSSRGIQTLRCVVLGVLMRVTLAKVDDGNGAADPVPPNPPANIHAANVVNQAVPLIVIRESLIKAGFTPIARRDYLDFPNAGRLLSVITDDPFHVICDLTPTKKNDKIIITPEDTLVRPKKKKTWVTETGRTFGDHCAECEKLNCRNRMQREANRQGDAITRLDAPAPGPARAPVPGNWTVPENQNQHQFLGMKKVNFSWSWFPGNQY